MNRLTLVASFTLCSLAACAKSGSAPQLGAPETLGATASADSYGAPNSAASNYGYGAGKSASPAAADAVSVAPMRNDEGEATVSGGLAERQDKPGLGTAYGEQRASSVRGVHFQRADQYNPDILLSMRYNDAEGVRQISQVKTGSPYMQSASRQTGAVSFTVRDEYGAPLPAAQVGADVYAIGDPGARYTIGVENHSAQRFEVVASVDGLDVIDGGEADFSKRGYVVDPYTSFAIEGWRTSDDSVAAFRFSDIDSAYAGQTGRPRNIGVIGVAFFREAGYHHDELIRRDSADPFPNRYPPPPPRPYGRQ